MTGSGASPKEEYSTPPHPIAFRFSWSVALFTAALLLPFLNKAFHADDTLFLAAVPQIQDSPLRPYDFHYNWFGRPLSMWESTQNPPLNSYLLALVGVVARGAEWFYHLAYLLLAVLSALLMYSLARRFCGHPVTAAALSVATPAFLVSATNVMADIPLLSLWLLAVCLTVRAADCDRPKDLWWSGLAASAAAVTKYFGIALVPLLITYWILQKKRFTVHTISFLCPILIVATWGGYSNLLSGHFHPLSAAAYSSEGWMGNFIHWRYHAGSTFSFLGGTLVWPVLLLPHLKHVGRWGLLIAASLFVGLGILGNDLLPDETSPVLWLALTAGGVALFVILADTTLRHRKADSTFLALWFFGTIAFVLFFNWTVAARVFLPAILPGVLLLLRSLEGLASRKLWIPYAQMTILPTVILALALAYSDQEWAGGSRAFAKSVLPTVGKEIRKSGRPEPKLLFMGHWGFQFYMERAGVRAVDGRGETLGPGDLIFVAHNNTNIREIYELPTEEVTKQSIPTTFPLHAMNVWSKSGFYSSVFGPVPFNWSGKYPADQIILHRFTGKSEGR